MIERVTNVVEQVTIRGFKRFQDITFNLPGHVVVVGPSNCGKTTLLQAIAAFGLALRRWKELNDFQRHDGGYTKAPISLQTFYAVPMRSFDLLWRNRSYKGKTIEIEIHQPGGRALTMELIADTTEQIYARPGKDAEPEFVRDFSLNPVFIPAMGGLHIGEPSYQPAKIEQLLGQARPGDVLRNLLVEASEDADAWKNLKEGICRLFNVQLLPPNAYGADILAEYQEGKSPGPKSPKLDIASGGAGFQQVLMLLAFLHTRKGAVLLLDEPDAHMHNLMQNAIYRELRHVAARNESQIIIATHSEMIIDNVDPSEICVMGNPPRLMDEIISPKDSTRT